MDYTKQWFERLFKDSYPHMYRMAYSMVEDADDAKDAVHQVFAQIWKGKPKVSDDSIRGYLLAATRNQCLHILRQRQLRLQMEEELRRAEEESRDEEHEELLQQLQQVIDQNLTEQDRRVLQLHYDEEMRLLRSWPTDRLLFATDFPWVHYPEAVAWVKSVRVPEDWPAVFGGNACRLLGI